MSSGVRYSNSGAPLLSVLVLLSAVSVTAAGCSRSVRLATTDDPVHNAARDSVEVGYGAQPERDVIGAVTRINGDVARASTPTTLADMLDGHVPGLDVRRLANGGMSLRIRGQRSFRADGEPLFVIDGVPKASEGAFRDLDPRDIKSIEVLRDAGSLTLYGSRGANGVILITTRRN